MGDGASDTDRLLDRAGKGDAEAEAELLQRHRERLKRMIAVRMDSRLQQRVDPSDVVQESLAQASQRLKGYLRDRPVSFYPWLRQIAWQRLVDSQRRHLEARRRSLAVEVPLHLALPEHSSIQLANQLAVAHSSPSGRAMRQELQSRVRSLLDQLPPRDREILVLLYLEQLSPREVSEVLGITEGAANVRHVRALQRLRTELSTHWGDTP